MGTYYTTWKCGVNAHVIEVKHNVTEVELNEVIDAPYDDGWHALSPSDQCWKYLGIVNNFHPPQASG